MFKKLIEQHKQKKFEKIMNKPEFKLGDLLVGEIVLYKKCEKIGPGKFDHHYREVKKFAFFYETNNHDYCHIISGQKLHIMGDYDSIIGDYAVHNIRPFKEAFPLFMRKHNLSDDSKVSYNFIITHEKEMNEQLNPNQKINELFR